MLPPIGNCKHAFFNSFIPVRRRCLKRISYCFPFPLQTSRSFNDKIVKAKPFKQRLMIDHRIYRQVATLIDTQRNRNMIDCTQTKSYSGLEATFYNLLRGTAGQEEIDCYHRLLKERGGTALELGCGTGRLLFPLLKRGVKVEGIDNSEDMLQICKSSAKEWGVPQPILHHFSMQNFQLPKKYDTIFVEGGTFMLLTDRMDVDSSLRKIYQHLTDNGQAIIELFLPLDEIRNNGSPWKLHKTTTRSEDNAQVFYSSASKCDVLEQLRTAWGKYEVFMDGRMIQSQLVTSQLRWYSKYEFLLMLEKVGFVNSEMINLKIRQGTDEDTTMIFRAFKKT